LSDLVNEIRRELPWRRAALSEKIQQFR